jgi:hypothetical protein
MHDGVGDQFAGEQYRVGYQVIIAGQTARNQRFTDKTASCSGRGGLGVEVRGSDEVLASVHMPSRCKRCRLTFLSWQTRDIGTSGKRSPIPQLSGRAVWAMHRGEDKR